MCMVSKIVLNININGSFELFHIWVESRVQRKQEFQKSVLFHEGALTLSADLRAKNKFLSFLFFYFCIYFSNLYKNIWRKNGRNVNFKKFNLT